MVRKNTKKEIEKKEIINFYELPGVQKFMAKTINPNYEYHKIKLHLRACIIGASGAGKSNTVLNILSHFGNTFNHMYIYTRAEEPLYNYLHSRIPNDLLTISYDLDDFRNFDNKKYIGQSLIIFDDLCNEKNQRCIEEAYIRLRKFGVSMLYLSQSFFKIPKTVRLQCDYCFIIKVMNLRDLNLILSEFSLNATKEQMKNMYNNVCNSNEFGNFFLIDMKSPQNSGLQYRKNFRTNLIPSNFN